MRFGRGLGNRILALKRLSGRLAGFKAEVDRLDYRIGSIDPRTRDAGFRAISERTGGICDLSQGRLVGGLTSGVIEPPPTACPPARVLQSSSPHLLRTKGGAYRFRGATGTWSGLFSFTSCAPGGLCMGNSGNGSSGSLKKLSK